MLNMLENGRPGIDERKDIVLIRRREQLMAMVTRLDRMWGGSSLSLKMGLDENTIVISPATTGRLTTLAERFSFFESAGIFRGLKGK
ncbi:MAG: hypothetical protein IPL01_05810 [Acidobacteria bacterium]|nr:hypothetical protein [Acidobacteriota bacterium]